MKRTLLFSIVAVLTFTHYSCKKDDFDLPDEQSSNEFYDNSNTFSADVLGRVSDLQGNPISGVVVKLGAQTYTTNSQGVYSFKDAQVSTEGTVLEFSHASYVDISQVVYPASSGNAEYNEIALLSSNSNTSFDGKEGGSIQSGNIQIDFGKKTIVDASGSLYEGTVDVMFEHLSPSVHPEAIPGGDLGLDAAGNQKFLLAHGVAAVKLYGSSGEALNLKEGETALIKVVSTSGEDASIWSYDEDQHYWIEEGAAEFINGVYHAEVSHFSFWSCASPYNPAYMHINFTCSGDPVLGTVTLKHTNGQLIGTDYTNQWGFISGQVPANLDMVLEFEDAFCGDVIYSDNIGPFTTYTNSLGPIEVCSNASSVTYEGFLEDCNNQAVSNGAVTLDITGSGTAVVTTDANGYFSGTFVNCGYTSMDVTGFDMDALLQSNTAPYSIQPHNNFGIIQVCSAIEEYFHYSMDGTWFSAYESGTGLNDVEVNLTTGQNPGTHLNCYIDNNHQVSTFTFNQAIGTFPLSHLSMNGIVWSNPTSLYVTFNTYNTQAGDFIEGTLSGTDVADTDSTAHTIGGNFRIMLE